MQPMRTWLLAAAAAAVIGCSDDSTSPADGGNGGSGAPAGSITIGDIFFRSEHNGTQNPAVDTVTAGTAVTWTWSGTSLPHSVRSQGSPSFASSDVLSGDGQTYVLTFDAPGTYHYDCAVHGSQMTGRIVVQ
jgi:manganese oxidase